MLEAIGNPGSWNAVIENTSYPCIHQDRLIGSRYIDPTIIPGVSTKADNFVELIYSIKKVIVTTGLAKRENYVSLCSVDEVICNEKGLQFKIVATIDEVTRGKRKK